MFARELEQWSIARHLGLRKTFSFVQLGRLDRQPLVDTHQRYRRHGDRLQYGFGSHVHSPFVHGRLPYLSFTVNVYDLYIAMINTGLYNYCLAAFNALLFKSHTQTKKYTPNSGPIKHGTKLLVPHCICKWSPRRRMYISSTRHLSQASWQLPVLTQTCCPYRWLIHMNSLLLEEYGNSWSQCIYMYKQQSLFVVFHTYLVNDTTIMVHISAISLNSTIGVFTLKPWFNISENPILPYSVKRRHHGGLLSCTMYVLTWKALVMLQMPNYVVILLESL